jgi:hypothetical protein
MLRLAVEMSRLNRDNLLKFQQLHHFWEVVQVPENRRDEDMSGGAGALE